MGLAQRLKKGLKKMVPASTVKYQAPAPKNQSTLSDEQLRKLKNKRTTPANKGGFKQFGEKGYKPSNGKGVGH